jgi:hypothetical protein
MFYYIFHMGITYPLLEWFIHYMYHFLGYKNNYFKLDNYIVFCILFFIYYQYYLCLLNCFRYLIIQKLIYKYPNTFKKYYEHNIVHTLNPMYNFGITSIWIDKLFRTQFRIKKM